MESDSGQICSVAWTQLFIEGKNNKVEMYSEKIRFAAIVS